MQPRVWAVPAWILAGLLAVMPAVVRAQEPAALTVTVDRDRVTVGERITVTVVLRLAADAQPNLTDLERQFDPLELLVVGLPEERPLGAGMKEIRVRYQVAAFRTGGMQLPALTVTFARPDGTTGAATSTPIPISVVSVIPPGADPADVRDLKGQIDLPYTPPVSSRAVAAVIAFVVGVSGAAALGGWLVWRRGRAPALEGESVPAPPVAPEAAARAELDRIAALGLLERGDLTAFHALLAACVRRYLSDRYGFPAFAMTTTELRARMEQLGVGRWQARLTAGLLAECDAVSYAGYRPAPARAESNLAMAYEIVSLSGAEAEAVATIPVSEPGLGQEPATGRR
jgi:hypothetical protein